MYEGQIFRLMLISTHMTRVLLTLMLEPLTLIMWTLGLNGLLMWDIYNVFKTNQNKCEV
jgi:hypothetical protein